MSLPDADMSLRQKSIVIMDPVRLDSVYGSAGCC